MIVAGRQLQAELRKLIHPLVALAVLVAVAVICAMQAAHMRDPYPGPSVADVGGCLRIAFLQHATTIGFLLAGIFAAFGTAEEASNGAIADTLLREPRRPRVACLKAGASCCLLLASALLSTGALWVTGVVERTQGVDVTQLAGSSLHATALDVASALLVFPLAAVLGLTLALVTRSATGTIITTAAVFALPLVVLDDNFVWATPTRWVVEWLHLDPLGEGVDYLARNSAFDHRGIPAFTSGALIAVAVLALGSASAASLSRTTTAPADRA